MSGASDATGASRDVAHSPGVLVFWGCWWGGGVGVRRRGSGTELRRSGSSTVHVFVAVWCFICFAMLY